MMDLNDMLYFAEVVASMAEHKYGSAVITDHGKVQGVFTTVDALRALATFVRRSEKPTA